MVFLVGLLGMFWFNATALAAPTVLSYQGRIVKTDGRPLEYENVSFLFQITNPTGTCVLYEEQVNGFNMTGSGGVFDAPIGSGTRLFPTSGSATILDSFNNVALSLPCKGGATFSPTLHDVRRLRVQFHDGQGWRLISPDNTIRSVPYASFALQAAQLGAYSPEHFVLKTGIPTCTANTFLSWNGTVLSCEPISGSAGGTVTDVTSTNAYLSVANGTSNASLTLNVGTSANTVAAGNDARFSDSRPPNGAAGGALAGTYPNPSLANNAVTTASITDGAVNVAKLAAGTASGQVLRYSGAAWQATKLNYADLINANGVSPWPGTCGVGEFITWVSVSDGFACSALNSSAVTTALGFTPANAARTLTAGTGLTGGGDLSANRTFAVDVGTGANQIPQLDASGKLNSSVLPASVGNGLWSGDGTNVYRSSGNVGIGTTNPSNPLHVAATGNSPVHIDRTDSNNSYLPGLMIRRMRSDATAPGSGFGTYTLYALEGFTNDSYPLAAAIGSTWESAQTNDTTDRDSSLIFETMLDNSKSEKMRITSTGNIGIGTATPTTKLEVVGTVKATAFEGPLTATTSTTGAGSNTAPSMTFSGDTNTGFYNASSNDTISVTTGGVQIFDFSSTGLASPTSGGALITTAAGSATAPTFSFTGDPDTGWFSPAANTLAAATGGSERIRIDSAGNVGIGATNPGSALEVNGTITAKTADPTLVFYDTTNAKSSDNMTGGFLVRDSANSIAGGVRFGSGDGFLDMAVGTSAGTTSGLLFQTDGTNRMRILGTGEVGIGTTTPSTKLHIHDTLAQTIQIISTDANLNTSIQFKSDADGTPRYGHIGYDYDENVVKIVNDSAFNTSVKGISIDTSGKVGIGTATPLTALHVKAGSSGQSFARNSGLIVESDSTLNNYYPFQIASPTGTIMTATGAGNVGIGGNPAGAKFEVTGATGTGNGILEGVRFKDSASGINLGGNDTDNYAWLQGRSNSTGLIPVAINPMGGNVGIGTSAPEGKMHIQLTDNTPAFLISSSGAANSRISMLNGTSTAGSFLPAFLGRSVGSTMYTGIYGQIDATEDTGTTPAMIFSTRIETPAVIATRPLFQFRNHTTPVMTLMPSGHIGIGTALPAGRLDVESSAQGFPATSGATDSAIALRIGGAPAGTAVAIDMGVKGGTGDAWIQARNNVDYSVNYKLLLNPNGGNVGIGTTTPSDPLDIAAGSFRAGGDGTTGSSFRVTSGYISTSRNTTAAASHHVFHNPNGVVGSINTSGTSTAYNTTSDARLKENFRAVESPLQRISQIEVLNYNYKKDPNKEQIDGYIAQQVRGIIPYAVTVPDTDYDASGEIKPWLVDYSKAVPLLTAGIQELNRISVKINSLGDVGIGTAHPSSRLHVKQSHAGVVGTFENSAGSCTLTPSSSAANWACSSDIRLKTNIQNISGEAALNRMLGLHAVTYSLKKGDDGRQHTGYIAQNVRDVASEFVTEGEDGLLQVSYTGFIPWITEGLKYLHLKMIALIENDKIHAHRISELEKKLQEKDAELMRKSHEIESMSERLSKIEALLSKPKQVPAK